MPDYKNSKIYTIRCRDDPMLIYVGSSTQQLSQRWQEHKRNAKNQNDIKYNYYFYQVMREKGIDNFYIELHVECPCENREQLKKCEGKVIRELGTLNSCVAGRTDKEYREETKEKKKEYYKNNHDKLRGLTTCECGCEITIEHIARHKKTQKHLDLLKTKNSPE